MNTLLKYYAKQKNLEKVKEIYYFMKSNASCQPTIFTLNNVLHSAVENSDQKFYSEFFK